MNPDIQFENIIPGIVTEYECRESASYSGYSWLEWMRLHWFERASGVAYFRVHLSIQAHINDEVRIVDERRSRKIRRR